MSIEQDGSAYLVTCDLCGDTDGRIYYEFMDAVAGRRESGWVSKRTGDDWTDICTSCQAEIRKRQQRRFPDSCFPKGG